MIKRLNWAIERGGGEYGSEDSDDSDLSEDERLDPGVADEEGQLTWAQAVATAEWNSDGEDITDPDANLALRGPLQTAKIGGFRGREFERRTEQDEQSVYQGDSEQMTSSQRAKARGEKQRAARKRKAQRHRLGVTTTGPNSDALSSDVEPATAQIDGGADSATTLIKNEAAAQDAKRKRKLEGFAAKEAAKLAYTAPDGRTMYRSPLFADMKIYSVEQVSSNIVVIVALIVCVLAMPLTSVCLPCSCATI